MRLARVLEPGVPGRVHPAEVVRTAGRGHQLAHLGEGGVSGMEEGGSGERKKGAKIKRGSN